VSQLLGSLREEKGEALSGEHRASQTASSGLRPSWWKPARVVGDSRYPLKNCLQTQKPQTRA